MFPLVTFLRQNVIPYKSIKPLMTNINNIIDNMSHKELKQYYFYPPPNIYKRLKIPVTNDKDPFELFLISWGDKSNAKMHAHPKNGCVLKVLDGTLNEKIFLKDSTFHKDIPLNINNISYLDDTIGYHEISNINPGFSHSLHIYSPPNFYSNNK